MVVPDEGRLVDALAEGRLEEVPVPTRPLVPTVGLELAVGLVVPTLGRVVELLLPTRPVEALPDAVGRVLALPLIEPVAVRPDTEAPLCTPLVA